jgi:predicted nucleic acid-binding protein
VKIYLDTSVISALFDDRNPERKKLTEEFFHHSKGFEIYISEITIVEIDHTTDTMLKEKMQNFIEKFNILPVKDELDDLINQYISYKAVPKKYKEDAYHIALAVLYEMDYLLSWNFRHIVRKKTRDIVKMISTINRLPEIEIITPAELL